MCGICGIYYFDPRRMVHAGSIERMCDALRHRGPDDGDLYLEGNLGLGHRRLGIIDVEGSRQPLSNEDGTLRLTLNGEIYNYLDLREELMSRGHVFSTKGDAEVIIHLYEESGEKCLDRLRGMFAFCLWDGKRRSLLLARDRLGIKPLYYLRDEHRLVFASELKAILQLQDVERRMDPEALDLYLSYTFIPAPLTVYRGIRKLLPGHLLSVEDGRVEDREYWDFSPSGSNSGEDESLHAERLAGKLEEVVRGHVITDVPLGALLSGGIDSSIVVALMDRSPARPVRTFSIGFEEGLYDELDQAREVAEAFRTDHFERIVKPDILDTLEEISRFLDEPFGDASAIPTYVVSKTAREQVKVALSGDGGDELFAGYGAYRGDYLGRWYNRLPGVLRKGLIEPMLTSGPLTGSPTSPLFKAKKCLRAWRLPPLESHLYWQMMFTEEEKRLLYTPDFRAVLDGTDPLSIPRSYFERAGTDDPLEKALYLDTKFTLPDGYLTKVDRMSMACSLEVRVPFLDHELVEMASGIPSRLKLRFPKTKFILKRAFGDILPPSVTGGGKRGFLLPTGPWIRGGGRPLFSALLSEDTVRRRGLFSTDYVARLFNEHIHSVCDHSRKIWGLLMLELWFRAYGE